MQELGREAGRYTRASRPLLRLFVSVMMIDRDDWSPASATAHTELPGSVVIVSMEWILIRVGAFSKKLEKLKRSRRSREWQRQQYCLGNVSILFVWQRQRIL